MDFNINFGFKGIGKMLEVIEKSDRARRFCYVLIASIVLSVIGYAVMESPVLVALINKL